MYSNVLQKAIAIIFEFKQLYSSNRIELLLHSITNLALYIVKKIPK